MNTKPIFHRECAHCHRIEPVPSADCAPICDNCTELIEQLRAEAFTGVRKVFDDVVARQVTIVGLLTKLHQQHAATFLRDYGTVGMEILKLAIGQKP